ncbi:P-loop containing nucleoside triphosphate hydrolase protein [Aspergillus keveii]|uniref:P-loop containing nucleoside triphosphate hydrolase protein n=1 Tax=Aspergillus keveii TaxID=714993 RepID=A0ABR4FWV9_9EURO
MTLSALLGVISIATAIAQPFLLRSVLETCTVLPVLGLFSASLIGGATEAHMKFLLGRIGIQLRAALTALLCNECMATGDRGPLGSDPLVLIEVDSAKVSELVGEYHLIWMIPLQTGVSIASLAMILGWKSVAAGFLSPAITLPLITYTTSHVSRRMIRVMQAKDSRVALITEVIKQIKQIKLGALQVFFQRRVDQKRAEELKRYKEVAVLNALLVFLVYVLPPALISLTFGTAILLGRPLPSNIVFSALAFCFNIARSVAALPKMVMLYQGGRISFSRIRDFLASSAHDSSSEQLVPEICLHKPGLLPEPVHLSMRGCDISFQDSPDASSKPILRDCNLQASSGSLLVISGAVGCGKTTLIRSIIRAVKPASGKLSLTGGGGSGSGSGTARIAYAPQKPFLISGTIRENILFGLPLDAPFYEEVLSAVSLTSDLARLPDGDATTLGGAEATLSGGQRARIALARAVYARREVVVLDDPLAAVDARVQAHLVERVLGPRGILRDTLRIVTSSSDSLMAQADVLYVVRDGTLSEAARPQPVHQKAVDVSQDTSSSQAERLRAVPTPCSGYGSITGPVPTPLIQAATSNTSGVTATSPLLAKAGAKSQTTELQDGAVGFETYLRFLKLAKHGGWLVVLMVAAASKLVDILAVYFLKVSSQEFESQGHSFKLAYYTTCALCGGALSAVFVLAAYSLCVIPTSRSIHAQLTEGVLESRFSFFDSTSLGQILNRFTNDINKIDTSVSGGLISLVALSVTATASILVIVAATPLSILYLAPIGGVYFAIQAYYQHACRQLRRLEMLTRGPILNTASEMRVGAAVIQTFDQQDNFRRHARDVIDDHIRVWLPFVALDSWLLLRLQVLSSIIQLLSAILLLYLESPPSTLGLVLNYLIQTTSQFTSLAKMRADLEADMTSVERVWSYASNIPEDDADSGHHSIIIPASWPQSPTITFRSYTASYAPGAAPCLSNLTLTIRPGEHVAVVGRTGAGKSSLTLALLRALEGTSQGGGSITIDGVDIASVNLVDLRRRVITLMPQQPAVFEGSVRENLDVEGTRTDEQLREAIDICQMGSVFDVRAGEDVLEYRITELGANLSAGQIQLLALSRALLAKAKIVILDEATAAMDASTRTFIQNVIKQHFRTHTVITITHHIESALEHDKVLVLHDGRVAGYGAPRQLIKEGNAIFCDLVAQAKVGGLVG